VGGLPGLGSIRECLMSLLTSLPFPALHISGKPFVINTKSTPRRWCYTYLNRGLLAVSHGLLPDGPWWAQDDHGMPNALPRCGRALVVLG
jgi:hypothetical protein